MKKITRKEYKKKALDFLDRRKHTAEENLRLAGAVGIILVFIGLFLPLIGVNTSLGFVNGAKSNEEIPLITPQASAFEVSAGDFVFHQQLKDFEIYGVDIDDIEVLGMNVYGILTTPFPSFDKLNDASSFLNSGTLDFLTDEGFVKFCTENLGSFGASIVAVGATISEIASQAGDALNVVTSILNELNKASEGVRAVIAEVENYLNLADNIFMVLFLFIIAAMVWFMVGRGPKYLPAIALTVFSVIFIAIGIGVLAGNSIIANAISSMITELNASIATLVNGVVPGGMDILNGLFSVDKMQFAIHIDLFCGAGWWLVTIGLVGTTVMAYITPKLREKQAKKLAEKTSK